MDCNAAFDAISSTCKGGGKDNPIYTSGSSDVGCGFFPYDIVPTTALELQDQHCYGATEFGAHGPIDVVQQIWHTAGVCGGGSISRTDTTTNRHHYINIDNVPQQYNVYWMEGCVLDIGSDSVDVTNPLNVEKPDRPVCIHLSMDDYSKCPDSDGSIQAGCVIYECKAQADYLEFCT
ncbi:hypothetical protein BJ170DRAFT_638888 [Xylariales sp. AK1849]|nr:hypothetical protein BJ170DRAFT_638888 [Xylariales sp. AK1849]